MKKKIKEESSYNLQPFDRDQNVPGAQKWNRNQTSILNNDISFNLRENIKQFKA
jgi:hypothetical protein